jgi:uncharacterized protein YbaR (Trm112 family)
MISRKISHTGTALSLSVFCAEFYGVTFGQFLKISVKSNFSKILRAFVVHYAKPNWNRNYILSLLLDVLVCGGCARIWILLIEESHLSQPKSVQKFWQTRRTISPRSNWSFANRLTLAQCPLDWPLSPRDFVARQLWPLETWRNLPRALKSHRSRRTFPIDPAIPYQYFT